MARLVQVGRGTKTHYRAGGRGAVPAGRARCEVDAVGRFAPYLEKGGGESPVREVQPGEPTCHWCQTRALAD
jgi:hypothetical protein